MNDTSQSIADWLDTLPADQDLHQSLDHVTASVRGVRPFLSLSLMAAGVSPVNQTATVSKKHVLAACAALGIKTIDQAQKVIDALPDFDPVALNAICVPRPQIDIPYADFPVLSAAEFQIVWESIKTKFDLEPGNQTFYTQGTYRIPHIKYLPAILGIAPEVGEPYDIERHNCFSYALEFKELFSALRMQNLPAAYVEMNLYSALGVCELAHAVNIMVFWDVDASGQTVYIAVLIEPQEGAVKDPKYAVGHAYSKLRKEEF